ncbi:hypothetical protein [Haloarchaeobius sp. DYHT-AS-18]|uniref:hypothetical protein n=1 Tax=Haloarchaeobius sp. DYHT-AS-18 TaxID=3446117 RepID=UPI003EBD031D
MSTGPVHDEIMYKLVDGLADQPGLRIDHIGGELGLTGVKPDQVNGYYPDLTLGKSLIEVESDMRINGHALKQATAFTENGDYRVIFLYPKGAQVSSDDFPEGTTIIIGDPNQVIRILRGDIFFESSMFLGMGLGLNSALHVMNQMRMRNEDRRKRAFLMSRTEPWEPETSLLTREASND